MKLIFVTDYLALCQIQPISCKGKRLIMFLALYVVFSEKSRVFCLKLAE